MRDHSLNLLFFFKYFSGCWNELKCHLYNDNGEVIHWNAWNNNTYMDDYYGSTGGGNPWANDDSGGLNYTENVWSDIPAHPSAEENDTEEKKDIEEGKNDTEEGKKVIEKEKKDMEEGKKDQKEERNNNDELRLEKVQKLMGIKPSIITLMKRIFPDRKEQLKTDDDNKSDSIKDSKIYRDLTSERRQFQIDKFPERNFRSRDYMEHSPIMQRTKEISEQWYQIERGMDATNNSKKDDDVKGAINIFQWSTQDDSNINERKRQILERQKQRAKMKKKQIDTKLLGMASYSSNKIVRTRLEIQERRNQQIMKERKERDKRIASEKKKKEEEGKRYSLENTKVIEQSEKKGFFSKLFGRKKSKIASDHISPTKNDKSDVKQNKDLVSLANEMVGDLKIGSDASEDELSKKQVEKSEDEDEDADNNGYNVLESQKMEITKNISDDVSENKSTDESSDTSSDFDDFVAPPSGPDVKDQDSKLINV